MLPDPDNSSKNAPAAINNLTNELMWAMHKFTNHNHLVIEHTSDDLVYFCDWQLH